jgi:hypothetical protein
VASAKSDIDEAIFTKFRKTLSQTGAKPAFTGVSARLGTFFRAEGRCCLIPFAERKISMKTFFAFAFVVTLSSATALAGDGRISQSFFAKMGLSIMKPMTDQEGSTIRGRSVGVSNQALRPVQPVQIGPLPRPPLSGLSSAHR